MELQCSHRRSVTHRDVQHSIQRHANNLHASRLRAAGFLTAALAFSSGSVQHVLLSESIMFIILAHLGLPLLATAVCAAVVPNRLPASTVTYAVTAIMAASVSMMHMAVVRFQQYALASPLERSMRATIACTPVVITCGVAIATWQTKGMAFWRSLRIGVACVGCVRIAGALGLRFLISPLPTSYPTGLPFTPTVLLSLSLIGFAAGFNLPLEM